MFYRTVNDMQGDCKPRITICKDKDGNVMNNNESIFRNYSAMRTMMKIPMICHKNRKPKITRNVSTPSRMK